MLDAPSTPAETALAAAPQAEAAATIPAPEAVAPRRKRIPHLGHVGIIGFLLAAGLLCTGIGILTAIYFHLFGVASINAAQHSMSFAIGTMVIWYGCAFVPAIFIFRMLWGRSFLDGLQWNASTARRLWPRLMATGVACFLIAMAAQKLLHFPEKSLIAGLLSTRLAVWVMFAFSVTVAPLCEEILFRGFFLPAFSTASDWFGERYIGQLRRPLLAGDHPSWSMPAVILGSIFTSAIFAAFHAGQIGGALGPIVLIFAVSLVLCAVRLVTRSLAASTLTHATYNFTLFAMMGVATHGFQNLPK